MYIFVYMYLNIYHVSACNAGDTGDASLIHGSGRSPEEGMATDSNILAWEILWTQEPGGLYSSWGRKESDKTAQAPAA